MELFVKKTDWINASHEAEIKPGSENLKPERKQKRKAPSRPSEDQFNNDNLTSSVQLPFFHSASPSSGSYTSSNTTGYSPSSRSFSSSSGSVTIDHSSWNENHRDLTVKTVDRNNQDLSVSNSVEENDRFSNEGNLTANLYGRGRNVVLGRENSPAASTKKELGSPHNNTAPTVCSSISGYVENTILTSSNSNLSLRNKPDVIPGEVGCSHLPPRLLSFESLSTLNHEGLAKESSGSTGPSDLGSTPHYVSLDYIKSAVAEGKRGRRREKEDDQSTIRSSSSVDSIILSSVESDEGSTINSDVVENLYNKITAATARHSLKNPHFRQQGDSGTGDIEKDLFPFIFPGRRSSSKTDDGSETPNNVDCIRPPKKETSSSAKVDAFLQRNFNNSNNQAESNRNLFEKNGIEEKDGPVFYSTGLPPAEGSLIAPSKHLAKIPRCDRCSGVICDANEEGNTTMNKAKSLFGQCFCHNGGTSEAITEIDYCNYNLKMVPEDIWDYASTLNTLLLESNAITELPKELFDCQNLRFLSVSDNDISVLPPALASLVNLNHLDISKNVVEDVPECIRCCKNLQVLDASVNPIERLSEGFTQLMSLSELYMNDCFLDFLPANFGRMSQLRVLELRDNQLQILPKSIRRLTQLKRLDLGGNAFQDWPDVISKLTSLTELWLDCNELGKVPSDIGDLTLLTYLDLSRNYLESIPNQVGNLVCLTDLLLSENSLTYIPDTIGFLKELTLFNMELNQVTTLPESFGKLHLLEEFDASHNKLAILPTSIGNLKKLHTLLLDNNKIATLPHELGLCQSLNILQLSRNNIEEIPEAFGDLSNLRVLNVCQNRLPHLPISMIKLSGLQALWISPNQSKSNVPLHAELHPKNGRRILTNILFPQLEKGLSRANTVLKAIGNSSEDYANDAADDDDLEGYAKRERGKTHVIFNLDAITYSTDGKDDVEVDEFSEEVEETNQEPVNNAIELLLKTADEFHSSPKDDFTKDFVGKQNLEDYSVNVPSDKKLTGLSVFSDNFMKDSNVLQEKKTILKISNMSKVKENGSLSDEDINEREILTKKTPTLVGLRDGELEHDIETPTEDEDVLPTVGMSTWSSHSNLPSALIEQTPEWNPDEHEIRDAEKPVEISVTNKPSWLPLSNSTAARDNTSDVPMRSSRENSGAGTNLVKNDDSVFEKPRIPMKPKSLKQDANKVNSLDNSSEVISRADSLNKQKNKPVFDLGQRQVSAAETRTHSKNVNTPSNATIIDKSSRNSKSSITAKRTVLHDLPFMDENELASVDAADSMKQHASKSQNVKNYNKLMSRSEAESITEQENFSLSPGYITEGKSSSVTSGESLPTTDLDSGVGNDVESQESITDVHEEGNDLEAVVSSSILSKSNHTSISNKNRYEQSSNRYIENSSVRRHNGWMAIVSKNDSSISTNLSNVSFKPLLTNPQSTIENMRVSQTRYVPSVPADTTTVTYSHDYNSSRLGRDKSKPTESTSNNNRVADNIKKFENFNESKQPLPKNTANDICPPLDEKYKHVPLVSKSNFTRNDDERSITPSSRPASVTTVPKTTNVNAKAIQIQKFRVPETTPSVNNEGIDFNVKNALDTFTMYQNESSAPLSSRVAMNSEEQHPQMRSKSARSHSSHQRKSKFEEALAATKHKHFRDKVEKMMQQRGPLLITTKRSIDSSFSRIPRITSPVPRALSPHANTTPLENLTADSNWSPEMGRADGRRQEGRASKTNSLHSRLKEKLSSPTATYNESQIISSSGLSRSKQSQPVRSLGQRGSTQRSSLRGIGAVDTEVLNDDNEQIPKQSLEEQLGQLLVDKSVRASGRSEERGFKPYLSNDSNPYVQMKNNSGLPTNSTLYPQSLSKTSTNVTIQNQRKPPMPADWKHQLLRHIERKKQEKDEVATMQMYGQSHSVYNAAAARVRSPSHGLENSRPSNYPADVDERQLGRDAELSRNSHSRRSFARSETDLAQGVPRSSTAPDIIVSAKRNSLAACERSSSFNRGSGTQPKPLARRSSGRYMRTRTPGPELNASESKRVELATRPKSAMDMPISSPAAFGSSRYGHSDWNVDRESLQHQQEKPRTLIASKVAPPSYEDHLLRTESAAAAAEKQNYHDYVNIEYVNHLRSSTRRPRSENKSNTYVYNDDMQQVKHRLHPLRSSGSHESILNLKAEKQYPYEAYPSIPDGIRSSNSHDSALDKPYQLTDWYHQPYPTPHNYVPHSAHTSHGYKQPDRGSHNAPYHGQLKTESRYGVIPPPNKTQRRSMKTSQNPRDRSKREHSNYEERYFYAPSRRRPEQQMYHIPPPHGFNDEHDEPGTSMSPSLQRMYGYREDESAVSAFRPYHQQQNQQNHDRSQPMPTKQSSYSHNPKPRYDDYGVYHQQRLTAVDQHRPRHHDRGENFHLKEQMYKYPAEYARQDARHNNSRLEDDQSGDSETSLSADVTRHWLDAEPGVELVTVTVCKSPTFGFHIMGGIDAGGNPYRPDDNGVFITYVAPGGAADGSVRPGDKILLVNGSDFVGITHKRAVDLLRNAGHVAVLVVERFVGRPV